MIEQSYLASVFIEIDSSLEETAKDLNAILGGFNLKDEDSGRFEDLPMFIDEISNIEVRVSGIPEGETRDAYEFSVTTGEAINPLVIGTKINSPFVKGFTTNLPVEANGYVNISQYSADYISSRSTLKCKPAWKI